MCLLWGYVESNKEDAEPRKFDVNAVADRYGQWYNSDPFDIGRTTENALEVFKSQGKTAADAVIAANMKNASSKSNGSTMRCMPHAIFLANLVKAEKYKEVYDVVAIESNLVHGQKMVYEANFVYIVALSHILNNPTASDRGQVAFDIAYKLSQGDMCQTVDQEYGEKVEWWMDCAKSWADEAKKEKAKGMKPPYLTQINDPAKMKGKDPDTMMMMGPQLIDIKKQ